MGKIIKFFSEVKQELFKITWLTNKEALISSMMVLVVVLIFSLLFVSTDFIIFKFVQFVLNIKV